jgi:uncharacterized protein
MNCPMKSVKDKMQRRFISGNTFKWLGLCLLIFSAFVNLHAQNYPERPSPPRLVNDLAGLLNPSQSAALEQKLDAYNDSTSTQIAIVIINSLNGMEKAQYATELAEKWGIGNKHKDNGVLILVSKTDRQIFIATGRGVEEKLPDAVCEQIMEHKIKPAFKQGDYYGGLNAAIDEMIGRLSGTFTGDAKDEHGAPIPFWAILVIAFVIFFILPMFFRGGGGGGTTMGSGGSFVAGALLGGLLGGGGGGRGGGDSGGGFGGFGGGSFGGGGAGGSW